MSSQSDSQDISREHSAEAESISEVESSSENPSAGNDSAVAEEVQDNLLVEMEAEDFEQENEDEELALAVQVVEEEEEKERRKVTVAVLPPRNAGEASSSRPLNAEPLRVGPGTKAKKKAGGPKNKGAVDQGKPVGIPEGYSFLNTEALELRLRADEAECYLMQLHVGPSATVVGSGPDDVLSRAPDGCFAVHILSVSMGLRFPLHLFLLEYLRYVDLAPCQLTPIATPTSPASCNSAVIGE
ncbi:unnamed protein product [Cuscuta europaea]|uniref:Uncharacterized protein n=1 Tax=Cuscuta europaea TaxID=41803 RepID=A0A9P0YZG7_CUSEU|nr:unnamed protein product [Cuscuta europaea]